MSDFGGPEEFTTWDGEPVSRERPHGAMTVLASRTPEGPRFLLLHRVGQEGDWAWTPPSGSRKPGEDVSACAARELHEETGVTGSPRPVAAEDVDWAVFVLEVPWGTEVAVDGEEHDEFEWVSFAEVQRRCRPAVVVESFLTACAASDFG
jgi:8-oxo-dGTP pyrophosphatase MutT (NUDIX family)